MKNIVFILLIFSLFACDTSSIDNQAENEIIKTQENDSVITGKYTKEQILDFIAGNYVYDEGCCDSKFELCLDVTGDKLNFYLETDSRKVFGVAEISIEEDKFVYIHFPITWDEYEGDLTGITVPYKGEMPQIIEMFFDPKDKTISFQNYGNAMNYYVKFGECGDKYIRLINKKYSIIER